MVTWDRESRRQSLWLWVHECEECGFVAPELRNSAPGDARHVASRAYRAELNRLERKRLASRFVCRSLLCERQLVVECDTACHTVAEAQGEPDAGCGAVSAETLH